jgi:hypothetical protein
MPNFTAMAVVATEKIRTAVSKVASSMGPKLGLSGKEFLKTRGEPRLLINRGSPNRS